MKEKNKMKLKKLLLTALAIVPLVLFGLITYTTNMNLYIENHTVPYEEFKVMVEEDKVDEITINFSKETFQFSLAEDDDTYYTDNPRYADFKKDLLETGVVVNEKVSKDYSSLFTILLYVVLILSMRKMVSGSLGNNETIGVENAKATNVTFKDVAGLKEVKADLMLTVDMMKNPKKYKDAGAKLPKGTMLYGPPGTGKTLLAKAIAGEAGVNFISVAGSDFSNKFVGVAADRVRKLFEEARKKAPCIIFIDEIDAVGGTRDGLNTHSEDRNTLNALLAEMDGFNTGDNILVIGATNRLEDLDPALIRPGRFDNIFAVPLPVTTEERREVIDVYAKGKKFDETVDFELLAKQMIGNSPADIEAVMNEASIIAARENNGIIRQEDIDEAYLKKILKGHVKDNKERDEEQLRIVAWHEAGHALVGALTNQEVTKVTILPSSSGAGGFTLFNPTKMGLYTKEELINRVLSLYAGRAAEELLLGSEKITTGASNDIERATSLINQIVARYGMTNGNNGPSILDYSQVPGSDKFVMDKMNEMAAELYNNTRQMLEENNDKLEKMASELLKKETLSEKEILDIIGGV